MSDDRTPDQREADDALHAAIEQVARAYQVTPTTCVITNWVVLGAGLGADTDGDIHQSFILLPNNGAQTSPDHLIGMLRTATLRTERDYLAGDQGED